MCNAKQLLEAVVCPSEKVVAFLVNIIGVVIIVGTFTTKDQVNRLAGLLLLLLILRLHEPIAAASITPGEDKNNICISQPY